jgi:hypothetical protein
VQRRSNFIVTATEFNGGFTSVWLGKRKRKVRCSGQNPQLRVTFREETCKEELHSGTVA